MDNTKKPDAMSKEEINSAIEDAIQKQGDAFEGIANIAFKGLLKKIKAREASDPLNQIDQKTLQELRVAAEQGSTRAQIDLGRVYARGICVEQCYEEAFKWFLLAAEKGDAQAQHSIGCMYYKGEGIDQSYEEAFRWVRLAAEQELWVACEFIASMYGEGKGVEKSYEEMRKWRAVAGKIMTRNKSVEGQEGL